MTQVANTEDLKNFLTPDHVDLSSLPAPKVVEELSFETIFQALLADFTKRSPAGGIRSRDNRLGVRCIQRNAPTKPDNGFVGADREITIDIDKQIIVVHDGKTVGGFPQAREDLSNVEQNIIAGRGIAKDDLSNVSAENIKKRGALLAADLVGMIIAAPLASFTGFLLCNGAAISRTTYAALFAKLGTTFGAGDESTTFNIPDYRGYFLRGKGGNSATDFVTAQGDAIRNIIGTFDGNIDDGQTQKTGAFYYTGTTFSGSISGNGMAFGRWCITNVNETQTFFLKDGTARKIAFSLTLKKYGEEKQAGALGIVQQLVGTL